uniref:Heat shock protein family B (small) member 11 n=1 Tax=Catharus ustulatus TaxID=91951 RepID=A0A8C3TI10_CATUS
MRATDWCRSSAGAALVLATSSDAEHPAESVADGSSKTFWTTTGMFPQELIIGFPKCVKISKVAIQCYLVRTLRIERSTSKDPEGFQQCIEKGETEFLPEFEATYLRFIIKSAFDHFVSVHRVMAEGTAEHT